MPQYQPKFGRSVEISLEIRALCKFPYFLVLTQIKWKVSLFGPNNLIFLGFEFDEQKA